MFKWLNLNNFLDTPEEWHALVIGFCEVLCLGTHKQPMPSKELEYIKGEWHYYMFGRALGVLCWIGFVALIKSVVL